MQYIVNFFIYVDNVFTIVGHLTYGTVSSFHRIFFNFVVFNIIHLLTFPFNKIPKSQHSLSVFNVSLTSLLGIEWIVNLLCEIIRIVAIPGFICHLRPGQLVLTDCGILTLLFAL